MPAKLQHSTAYINISDALAAAQEGLKLDKSSIYNLFEKASAELDWE